MCVHISAYLYFARYVDIHVYMNELPWELCHQSNWKLVSLINHHFLSSVKIIIPFFIRKMNEGKQIHIHHPLMRSKNSRKFIKSKISVISVIFLWNKEFYSPSNWRWVAMKCLAIAISFKLSQSIISRKSVLQYDCLLATIPKMAMQYS